MLLPRARSGGLVWLGAAAQSVKEPPRRDDRSRRYVGAAIDLPLPLQKGPVLARSPEAPEGAPVECDRERVSVGVIASPRTQSSWRGRSDDCIARMMRKSNRARSTSDAALCLLWGI